MVEIQFILMLSFALYYIFKPSVTKVDFVVDGEKVPLDGLEYYLGLLRLHGVALSPEVITEAFEKQQIKTINNHQPGDASVKQLEAAKEYLLTRCSVQGSLN